MAFGPRRAARAADEKPKPPPKPFTPVAPGSHASAAIILLSDGRRTTGVETLEAAKMTGGEYHHAGTAEALRTVYQNLGSSLQVRTRDTELTALLALAAAVVLLAGTGLSILWFGRAA
jgi:Ca-activated chloride channel family protein